MTRHRKSDDVGPVHDAIRTAHDFFPSTMKDHELHNSRTAHVAKWVLMGTEPPHGSNDNTAQGDVPKYILEHPIAATGVLRLIYQTFADIGLPRTSLDRFDRLSTKLIDKK